MTGKNIHKNKYSKWQVVESTMLEKQHSNESQDGLNAVRTSEKPVGSGKASLQSRH